MGLESIKGVTASFQTTAASGKSNSTVKQVEPIQSKSGVDNNASKDIAVNTLVVDGKNDYNDSSMEDKESAKSFTDDRIKKSVAEINKQLDNTECVFGINELTNRVTIKIVDKDTKEVIKELPPEKTLKMIAKAWELAGILVDEKL